MQNVDVAQDSRLAALAGTAYAGPAVKTPASKPVAAYPSYSNANFIALSTLGWQLSNDPNSTVQMNSGMEYIDGQERDVLTLNVNLAKGDSVWAGGWSANETLVQKLKAGSGVRFKVLGDGKSWSFGFPMADMDLEQYGWHRVKVSTKKGRTVEVDVPFSKLRQPDWGKRAKFDKNNIGTMTFEKHSENGAGSFTIKVFDLEIY
jgi:hypothetical protein